MALSKHMAQSDLLRIRKMMARGILDVASIQEVVPLHTGSIQHILDVGLDAPAKAAAEAAARDKVAMLEARATKAAEAVKSAMAELAVAPAAADPVDPAPAPAAPAPAAPAPAPADPPPTKKQTAAEKAKAKAAAVNPVS